MQRWEGIERPYDTDAVERLQGTVQVEHTLARNGAEKLWSLLNERAYVAALGASTGNQAVQQVRAGLEAIYLSGWQVAADANLAGQMYPTRVCTRSTASPRSCARSTRRCCAPTRSTTPTATTRSTGWCRSSPTWRPASAGT